MNIKSIIFKELMARSLKEGQKTQDRRVVKPQPYQSEYEPETLHWPVNRCGRNGLASGRAEDLAKACPYGQPGDLLWVRERWGKAVIDRDGYSGPAIQYWGDGTYVPCRRGECDWSIWSIGSRNEMFIPANKMPRWASRLTLRLTNVRVERLKEISYADARAEGTPDGKYALNDPWCHETTVGDVKIHEFSELWDAMQMPKGARWHDNPWVWVLEFEVIHANVDSVLEWEGEA